MKEVKDNCIKILSISRFSHALVPLITVPLLLLLLFLHNVNAEYRLTFLLKKCNTKTNLRGFIQII